jgi:hypothetical protein
MYNETQRHLRKSLSSWNSSITYLYARTCMPERMHVRECSLAYPACNMYAPYCDIICGPSGSTIFFDITS